MVKDPRLPNFFILGAAKCGTTSLYHYLKQHPEIYLPRDKEPHFFDNDTFWNEGLETYLDRHFQGAERYPVRGEATPAYFHQYEKVIPRMKQVYRDMIPKFILIFRDPVDRAWSHYLHMKRNGLEKEDFGRALKLEEKRLQENPHQWWGYFRDGLYARQLEPWLNAFPRSQFKFILTEDLKQHPTIVCKEIFTFLGVTSTYTINTEFVANRASRPRSELLTLFLYHPFWLKKLVKPLLPPYARKRIREAIQHINVTPLKEKPKLGSELEWLIREKYMPEIERLEHLTGLNLSKWKKDKLNADEKHHAKKT